MCEFCEEEIDKYTNYYDYLIGIDENRLTITGREVGYNYLEINFCPMCGKKL